MNVEWYSNKVKPVEPYYKENDIAVAISGKIVVSNLYLPDENAVFFGSLSKSIPLDHPCIDGWCYVKDLYPKETKI